MCYGHIEDKTLWFSRPLAQTLVTEMYKACHTMSVHCIANCVHSCEKVLMLLPVTVVLQAQGTAWHSHCKVKVSCPMSTSCITRQDNNADVDCNCTPRSLAFADLTVTPFTVTGGMYSRAALALAKADKSSSPVCCSSALQTGIKCHCHGYHAMFDSHLPPKAESLDVG